MPTFWDFRSDEVRAAVRVENLRFGKFGIYSLHFRIGERFGAVRNFLSVTQQQEAIMPDHGRIGGAVSGANRSLFPFFHEEMARRRALLSDHDRLVDLFREDDPPIVNTPVRVRVIKPDDLGESEPSDLGGDWSPDPVMRAPASTRHRSIIQWGSVPAAPSTF